MTRPSKKMISETSLMSTWRRWRIKVKMRTQLFQVWSG